MTKDESGQNQDRRWEVWRSTRTDAPELIILLHAFSKSPESLRGLADAIQKERPSADLWIPALPLGRLSMINVRALVRALLTHVNQLWQARASRGRGRSYAAIHLVGHSFGALLVRKLYVTACGEGPEAPFEPELRGLGQAPWAGAVRRVVLLAGMNRGWRISHHLSISHALWFSLGSALASVLMLARGRRPAIFEIRRGAPFLTELRIQWLAMRQRAAKAGVGSAPTVQLLGTIDDLVSPDDNVDLVSGRDFFYLEVPKTGHADIVDVNASGPGQVRRQKIIDALFTPVEKLTDQTIALADTRTLSTEPDVTDVVFVIHGIRDEGHWTQRVARKIQAACRTEGCPERKFAAVTASYGYFPMLPFLFPGRRREKVEWLMDQYAEARARFPAARFHYVGHSNGTYLVARAFREYPCCRFTSVTFAGSVVRRDYLWSQRLQSGQCERVLNYVATRDFVVAVFPNGLEPWRFIDLGGAGHRGFQAPEVQQVRYVDGGHSAALAEENWDAIARFVVTGKVVLPPPPMKQSEQPWISRMAGTLAPVAFPALVLAAIALGLWILVWPTSIVTGLLAALTYYFCLWKIVTRL